MIISSEDLHYCGKHMDQSLT